MLPCISPTRRRPAIFLPEAGNQSNKFTFPFPTNAQR